MVFVKFVEVEFLKQKENIIKINGDTLKPCLIEIARYSLAFS